GAFIMKDPRDIIKRPAITEHSADLMADKKYTFEVSTKANKSEINNAVAVACGVKDKKVNTMNVRGKLKRMGQCGGYRADGKKVIVELTEESKDLEFFEA